MMKADTERLIRQCFALARRAREKGDHPFGALLAGGDEILLSALNTVNTDCDPTRHAELNLVSLACRRYAPEILAETTLYTSTEPCVMCAGAIYWAGIPRVVYGVSARALGRLAGGSLVVPCRDVFGAGRRGVAVTGPVLEDEGLEVHAGFWG